MQRILILDARDEARRTLAGALVAAGYAVTEAADGTQGAQLFDERPHDLLLVADADGEEALALLRRWRAGDGSAVWPVILLVRNTGDSARIAGLRAGADDVLSRPFGNEELLARIEAVLRRCHRETAEQPLPPADTSGLSLDVHRLQVVVGDRPVHLGPIEFRLLSLFMNNPERALSRTQIVERVWRQNTCVDERTVDAHIRRLRRALQDTGHDRLIQTVRGVGYRFAGGPTSDRAS